MSSENGLELVVNIYYNPSTTIEKIEIQLIYQKKKRKWNHIKYLIKAIKGRKVEKDKNRNKEQ